ncbi:hypothetical protein [Sneathiella limimaris]|uniref:hypothetical protein n=1 Tax=Sneathiella limimaris TaxID=1964213 RepID=UPI00146E93C6|nr:hypothetical protein [Sneathiella limimaris]
MDSQTSIKHYIAQRFRRQFPKVPYFFVIELNKGTSRKHIHGALHGGSLSEEEIRTGLQKISGDKRKLKGFTAEFFYDRKATHTDKPNWDLGFQGKNGIAGWSQYCAKETKKTQSILCTDNSLISCSQSLNREAKRIYTINHVI